MTEVINGRIKDIGLTITGRGVGYIEVEIPIEKVVDGEIVTVDTKAIPIITEKTKIE